MFGLGRSRFFLSHGIWRPASASFAAPERFGVDPEIGRVADILAQDLNTLAAGLSAAGEGKGDGV